MGRPDSAAYRKCGLLRLLTRRHFLVSVVFKTPLSKIIAEATLDSAWAHAKDNLGDDPEGYRAEFLMLVETAQKLAGK